MGALHDAIATKCGDQILNKIRIEDQEFKQIFTPNIIRSADWDWPRPDYVCYDEGLKCSYALEFKPPGQNKREYLTGLGQALAYLQKHTYSGLIIPYNADDGFRIADYIYDTLIAPEFGNIPTSLFSYNVDTYEVKILRSIDGIRKKEFSPKLSVKDTTTFWCWWRDLSHYELFDLLNLSFLYNEYPGDIYTDFIYPRFYNLMMNKKTKQWNGEPRNKKASERSRKSEKQNYKIPLMQLGLWTASEGRLTDLGYQLLRIGKKYGPSSKPFIDELSYLILVEGRHIDLIHAVRKFQDEYVVSEKSSEYTQQLDIFLDSQGFIGKRKPTAITTGAKISYMRDEMKLWNKLGLMEKRNNTDYFFPNEGYRFNWEKITDILTR